MVQVSPSILTANFSNLAADVDNLIAAGVQYLHLDVMDGCFVPNLSFGPKIIADLRRHVGDRLLFDVHLMIADPERYIEEFAKAGADLITIHAEATRHPHRALQLIKHCQKRAGLSLVPTTHIDSLPYVSDLLDLVLVMTVNPGFGGQQFIQSQLNKLQAVRQFADAVTDHQIMVEADGGINADTAPAVIAAGAELLVSGSYLFNEEYYQSQQPVEYLQTRIARLVQKV